MDKIDSYFEKISPERLREFLRLPPILNSSLDMGSVLKSTMNLANKLTHSEASSLLLLDESSNQLYFKSVTGNKAQEVQQFKIKMGEGIAGWVAKMGRPLCVQDVESDSRYSGEISQSIDFPTKSILCVPLKCKNRVIGVVEVINKEKGGRFTDEDQYLLELLADQAAIAIDNAKWHGELNQENKQLRETLKQETQLVGNTPGIRKILAMVEKAAPTDSTILLRGESGTGKELLAQLIHQNSKRLHRPFICITCSILSDTLLESELFGHEKGAFTGAMQRKIGRFEMANRGTVFLDEIGTLNPSTQLRLLRVLQERELERVGGDETIQVDLRIIAATNENLEKAIERGTFREDLYYRLKVIEICLPPLRERKDDIPYLTKYFLEKLSKQIGKRMTEVSPEAAQLLAAYNWPGNIRELRNTLERAVVLGSGEILMPEDLPQELTSTNKTESPTGVISAKVTSLEDAEKNQIQDVLKQTHWNKSKAAKILKISRNRLDRKLKSLDIEKGN